MSIPRFLCVLCIRRLAALTAEAFRVPAPPVHGPWPKALDIYAVFTAEAARRALADEPRLESLRARLFVSAQNLGSRLRAVLLIRSARRAVSVMRALYQVIGVDFHCADGEFRVRSCRFARVYSPQVCMLISSLDDGLFRGLSGGERLQFRRRITEGAEECAGYVGGLSA